MKKLTKALAIFMAAVIAVTALSLTAGAASLLPAPTGIKGSVTEDSLTLTWNKVKGADAYRVYKYDSSTKKYKKYKDVTKPECELWSLKSNTTYKFKIAALVKKGGKYSAQTQSGIIKATTAKTSATLTAPQNFKGSAYELKTDYSWNVDLKWDSVKGAQKYEVYYKKQSDSKYSNCRTVTGTKTTINFQSSMYSAGAFNFKVRAIAESGGKKVRSKFSPVITLNVDLMGAFGKPVIYLYPEAVTDVSVSVRFADGGKITCSYPEYNGGWNVTAQPDGTLYDKDGNSYYCLFWEGEGYDCLDCSKGWCVAGEETAAFLREKLL